MTGDRGSQRPGILAECVIMIVACGIMVHRSPSLHPLEMRKRELKTPPSPGNFFVGLPPGCSARSRRLHAITLSYAEFASYLQALLMKYVPHEERYVNAL